MSLPLGTGANRLPPIRLDREPLDRGWRPPRRDDLPWTAAQKFLVVVAVLLLVIGGIWAGGGFAQRTDRVKAYTAGQVVDGGPMTFTFDRVEIRFQGKNKYSQKDFDKWVLTAYGTATSKQQEPVLFGGDPGLVILANGKRFEGSVRFGAGSALGANIHLEPALRNQPILLRAEIPGDWRPPGLVQVGLWQQTYGQQRDNQNMADTSKSWGPSQTALMFWCPVTIVPPETP